MMEARDRFRRVEELFRAACAIESKGERARFLDEHCDDDEVRDEVLGLLEEDSSPLIGDGTTLELGASAFGGVREPTGVVAAPEVEGYRIVRVIGEGGMGVVYEAEQERPSRRVALKVLKPGFGSAERARRFQLEAELLGRLRHAGVAQIFGVGTASDGRPFFAMELVEGEPITSFAEREGLGMEARVELFARVCDAVQHAHQHGVIHRDLKPGNILVERGENSGGVKVLDFGIGRAVEEDVGATLQTTAGQLIGTVAYMSPEQASGDPGLIDTRTDVYSLGVVLFEVLCSRRPYDVDRMALTDALEVVRSGPATRLGSIDRHLRGDAETITLKAMEKDKERRYQSVGEFGEDLRRFLRDEPIVARPPSTMYQFRKFTARNRALVVGASCVVLALLVGLVGVSIALQRARRAEHLARDRLDEVRAALERADQAASVASAAKAFLTEDMLAAASPDALGPETPVHEVLRAASEHIDDDSGMDPLFKSEILVSLGKTLQRVGEFDLARRHLEDAIAIRKRVLGPDHLLTADAMKEYDTVHVQLDAGADRVENTAKVLEIRRRELGPEDSQTIVAMNDHALALNDAGRREEAEALYDRALALSRRVLGDESTQTATILNNLGDLYEKEGRTEEAESAYKEALTTRRKVLGERNSRTLLSANALGSFYWRNGRYAEAEPLYVETLAVRREILGERHPHTINSLDNLGTLYVQMGDGKRGLECCERALQLRKEVQGEDSKRTFVTMNNVAASYRTLGNYAEAERLFGRAFEGVRRLGGDEALAGWLRRNQAEMLWKLGRMDEAEAAMKDALEITRGALGDGHERTRRVASLLVEFYEATGREVEARAVSESLGVSGE